MSTVNSLDCFFPVISLFEVQGSAPRCDPVETLLLQVSDAYDYLIWSGNSEDGNVQSTIHGGAV